MPSSARRISRACRNAASASACRPHRYRASMSWPPNRSRMRMGAGQLAQLGDQAGVPAQPQVGVDARLEGGQPQLGQPRHLVAGQRGRGHVGQRLAAPQRQRLGQQARRRGPVAPLGRRPGLVAQAAEPVGVQLGAGHRELVAGPAGDQAPAVLRAQPLADQLDVALHRVPRARRGLAVPQHRGQRVHGDDLAGPQQQHGQHRPLAGRERQLAAARRHAQRAEESELHASPVWNRCQVHTVMPWPVRPAADAGERLAFLLAGGHATARPGTRPREGAQ